MGLTDNLKSSLRNENGGQSQTDAVVFATTILIIASFVAGGFLLVAASKSKPVYLLPWLVFTAIEIIGIPVYLILTIVGNVDDSWIGIIIVGVGISSLGMIDKAKRYFSSLE